MTADRAANHPENSRAKGLTILLLLLVPVVAFAGGVFSGGVTISINELGTYGANPLKENSD